MHAFPTATTAFYAAMLGIMLVLISMRVSLLRSKFKVMFGDGGLIYSADRAGTGLHIIRLTGRAARVAAK